MRKIISKVLLALVLLTSFQPANIQAAGVADKALTIQAEKDTTDTTGNTDSVSWPAGPSSKSLSAASAIVMDADTGFILYSKNMDKRHYPASITKILTTLLCIENSSLDDKVTFTKDEVLGLEYGASNISTQPGEVLTMEQCLYAIMMESANEVCLGVADHIGGSISGFADMMNKRAKELGCKNTHFTNPNGLHNDKHYTSAYDMALISREAIQNETFRKVTGTKVMYLPKTNKFGKRTLRNHHNMLHAYTTSSYIYDNCIGGKTGFTSAAQSTLVTYAEKDGMTLICVVMRAGSPKQDAAHNEYTDTAALLDFGFENYQSHNLSATAASTDEVEAPLFTTFNTMFDSNKAPLKMSNNGKIILPNGVSTADAKQNISFYDKAKTVGGQRTIGKVTYTYGNKTVGETDIYFNPDTKAELLVTDNDISYSDSKKIAGKTKHTTTIIMHSALIIGGILLLIVLVVLIRFVIRQRDLSKRKSHYEGDPKKKDLHF